MLSDKNEGNVQENEVMFLLGVLVYLWAEPTYNIK